MKPLRFTNRSRTRQKHREQTCYNWRVVVHYPQNLSDAELFSATLKYAPPLRPGFFRDEFKFSICRCNWKDSLIENSEFERIAECTLEIQDLEIMANFFQNAATPNP